MATILDYRDLGQACPYGETLALQERLHRQRVAAQAPDTLLLLEHRAVYTLGRSASAAHILLPAAELAIQGIECCQATRGGDVTYHGPGQLVGYPIIHLGDAGLGVLEYIEALEEVLLRSVSSYGIKARRDLRNRGIWVGNAKLAALGIRVSRQVTMHGFALNAAPDLTRYSAIIPCGLPDAGVTSLALLLGKAPPMAELKRRIHQEFCGVLGYEWERSG